MKIGYLHLGDPADGVTRYGRLLAAEVRRLPGVEVREAAVGEPPGRAREAQWQTAADVLRECDLLHLQVKARGSRPGKAALGSTADLRAFLGVAGVPHVVTVHDLYPRRAAIAAVSHRLRRRPGPPSLPPVLTEIGRTTLGHTAADRAALSAVLSGSRAALVTSSTERDRLPSGPWAVEVIPHFVERRPSAAPSHASARARLGIGAEPVLTLLGYIQRSPPGCRGPPPAATVGPARLRRASRGGGGCVPEVGPRRRPSARCPRPGDCHREVVGRRAVELARRHRRRGVSVQVLRGVRFAVDVGVGASTTCGEPAAAALRLRRSGAGRDSRPTPPRHWRVRWSMRWRRARPTTSRAWCG